MHIFAYVIKILASPILMIASTLVPALSSTFHHRQAESDFNIAAFIVSSGLVGLLCSFWAGWAHVRFRGFRAKAERETSQRDAAIRLRDALLAAGEESIAVLATDMTTPFYIGDASLLLQSLMSGPDAGRLAGSLDILFRAGTPFKLFARTPEMSTVAVRGATAGGRAAIFLRDMGAADSGIDYRAALNMLPLAVWIRGQDLALRWVNRKFLEVTGTMNLQNALSSNVAFEKSERELAAAARDGGDVLNARRFFLAKGDRRALALSLLRIPDDCVVGVAADVTELLKAEAQVLLDAEAAGDLLDQMPFGVAIFGENQRLIRYNRAYATMLEIDIELLNSRPLLTDILDWMRESGTLPERRDFAMWKQSYLNVTENCASPTEEVWHLADGKSIRVLAKRHLLGGVFFIFEDVSERLRLESSLKTLGQVVRATLDTVDEGIAIFWPDGRMVVHNKIFAKMWSFAEEELSGEPHLAKVAKLAQARTGYHSIWTMVSTGVASDEPDRCNQWGKVLLADGRVIALSMSRLPNGATVANFADLTNLDRFEAMVLEESNAAA